MTIGSTYAVADALDLVVAQLDVLGVDAFNVERRELRVIVQDHHAADIVEAACATAANGNTALAPRRLTNSRRRMCPALHATRA
jgi:hypothetical protein